MINEGVLENLVVDRVIALHCCANIDIGKIGIYSGNYMVFAEKFSISIIGKEGYVTYPYKSIDPVFISGHFILGLQKIISMEINVTEKAVISIGSIYGGNIFNIIPEKISLNDTVGYLDDNLKTIIKKECIKH